MKVCTDACLQAAYAVSRLGPAAGEKTLRILDIGTGTGVLALMLRQELNGQADAVEIDEASYRQAKDNIAASPWVDSMRIYHADIRAFCTDSKYDFIISNPPFFDKDLKGEHVAKNQAKHTVSLQYGELISSINRNMLPGGSFCIMLPPKQFGWFEEEARQSGYHPGEVLKVRHAPRHAVSRIIAFFQKPMVPSQENEICIRDSSGGYTSLFVQLLQPYYLHFPG